MRLLSSRSLPLQTAALGRTRKLFAPPPKSPIFALLLSIQASAVTRAMCLATTTSANAREQLRGHSRVHPARLHRALGFVIYVENEALFRLTSPRFGQSWPRAPGFPSATGCAGALSMAMSSL